MRLPLTPPLPASREPGSRRTVGGMGAEMIDWDVAVVTARRLVRSGPVIPLAEAKAAVRELRALAVQAEGHVREATRLVAAPDAPPVAVVDRPGWVQSNVDGFRVVLGPLLAQLAERRSGRDLGGLTTAVGSRVTGAQLGAILAYLASRVLGQYELFLPPGQGTGRLTLVAPNIVATEQALRVDPHDFRLWVCLHEECHRTQFTAVPWLRGHVQSEVAAFLDATELEPAAVRARLRAAAGVLVGAARGDGSAGTLIEAVQSPRQRVVLDRLTGLMSLVEGHSDYVMDAVGPEVVPSVEVIRRRFSQRRQGAGRVDRVVRKLLGLDLKMAQYAEGAAFVRAVVDAVGLDGFNAVWESPSTLPGAAEIRDPDAWLARVHGHRRAVPA